MGDGNCLENSWSFTGLGSSTLPRLRQIFFKYVLTPRNFPV